MKLLDKKLGFTLLAAGLLAVPPGGALAQGVNHSLNLAAAAIPQIGDLGATVLMVEYERQVRPKMTVYGRVSSLDWEWDDDVYVEDGKGTGFGGGVRFYRESALKGFFVGAGISSFKSKWNWTEGTASGSGKTSAIQWGAEVGYRFALSPRMTIAPVLQAGQWVGADDTCRNSDGSPCTKESELGFYVVPSVSLTIAF